MVPRPSDVDLSYVPSMRRLEGGGEAGMSYPLSSDGITSRRFKQDKMRGLASSRRRAGSSFVPAQEDEADVKDLKSWEKGSDSAWSPDSSSLDKSKRGPRKRGTLGTLDVDATLSLAGSSTRPNVGEVRSAAVSVLSQTSVRVSTRLAASPKASSPSGHGRPRSPPPSLRASVASAPPAWAPTAPTFVPSMGSPQEQSEGMSALPSPTLGIPHSHSSRPASPVPSPMSASSQRMGYRGRWSSSMNSGPSPTAGRLTIMDPVHRKLQGERVPGASLSVAAAVGRGLVPGSPSATASPGRLPTVAASGSPRRISLAQRVPGQVSVSTFDSALALQEGETCSPRAGLGRPGDAQAQAAGGDWGNMWRDAIHRTQASARRFTLPVQRGMQEGPESAQKAWEEGVSAFVGMLERGKEQGQAALERLRTAVFERVDGERSFCPRCRGSGFSKAGSGPMGWLSGGQAAGAGRATDNGKGGQDPCWFCQGIGVMPILDLEGYVVARSPVLVSRTPRPASTLVTAASPVNAAVTSAFTLARRTRAGDGSKERDEVLALSEFPQSTTSPMVPQGLLPLYLGKFPEARCCFRLSRLPKSLRKAFFAPPAAPTIPLSGKQLHMRELQILAQVVRPEIPSLKPAPAGKGQGQGGSQGAEQQPVETAVCGACGFGVPADAGRCPSCASKLVLREGEWAVEESGVAVVGSVRAQSARARTRQLWEMQREHEQLQRNKSPPRQSPAAGNEGGSGMRPVTPPPRTVLPSSPRKTGRTPTSPRRKPRPQKAGAEGGEVTSPRKGGKGSRRKGGSSKKPADAVQKAEAVPTSPRFLRLRNRHQAPVPGVDEVSPASSRGLTPGSSVPSSAKAAGVSTPCSACEAGIPLGALASLPPQEEEQESQPSGDAKHALRGVLSHTCSKGAVLGGGVLAHAGSPRVMGMRSPRRMERNRIREQAEKHAQDRARWRQHQLSMAQAQSPRRHCQPTSADAAEGSDFCYIGDEEVWGP